MDYEKSDVFLAVNPIKVFVSILKAGENTGLNLVA